MTATVYGVPDVAPLDVEKRRDVVRRVLRGPRVRRAVQDCKRLGDRRLSRCQELAQGALVQVAVRAAPDGRVR